jgi:hypothetical protein
MQAAGAHAPAQTQEAAGEMSVRQPTKRVEHIRIISESSWTSPRSAAKPRVFRWHEPCPESGEIGILELNQNVGLKKSRVANPLLNPHR